MSASPASARGDDPAQADDSAPLPTITVHRGNATAHEIAALTVLAAALGGSDEQTPRSARTGWTSGARRLTQVAVRGAGWGRG